MRTSRATVAIAAALAMLLTACGGSDDDAAPSTSGGGDETVTHDVIVTLQPGIPPTVPIQVGLDQGIFEKHGVNLELLPQPSGVVAQTLLTSGTANFSVLSPTSIGTSFQQGEEFSYACGAQLFNPVSLVAPSDSDLPSVADGDTWQEVLQGLEGKTVGLPLPIGSGSTNLFVATLADNGVDTDSVTILNTGSGPTLQGAIEGKQVDAAVALSPGTERLTTGSAALAKELVYMPDGPTPYRDYGTGWVASRDWLTSNTDAANAFCDAMEEVEEFIEDEANAEAFEAAITAQAGELEPEQLSAVAERLRPLFKINIPKTELEAAITTGIEQGVLEAEPRPTFDDVVFADTAR